MKRVPLLAREVEVIHLLHQVAGLPVTKIVFAADRNKSTVYDALDRAWVSEKRVRKELLTKVQVSLLIRTTKALIKKTAAKREVTLAMTLQSAELKISERCKSGVSASGGCVRSHS